MVFISEAAGNLAGSLGGGFFMAEILVPGCGDSSLSPLAAALCFGDGCNGCETFF